MSAPYVQRERDAATPQQRLRPILAALSRLGQARCARALGSIVALAYALDADVDLARLLLAGTVGLVLLAWTLSDSLPLRLSLSLVGLVLLLGYAWSASESTHLQAVLNGPQFEVSFAGSTYSAELGQYSPRRLGLTIEPRNLPAGGSSSKPIATLGAAVQRLVESNLSSGVVGLRLIDLDGSEIGPARDYWQAPGTGPPIPAMADQNDRVTIAGSLVVFDAQQARNLVLDFDLRNGGPPASVLLIDERLNGFAVRLWPSMQTLSLLEVRDGQAGRPLGFGTVSAIRPLPAALQALLRELLRPALLGLVLVALGVLFAPLARQVPGLADWRAPTATAWIAVIGGVIAGLLATAWIAVHLYAAPPRLSESAAYLFQARLFADGLLAAPAPPFPAAFQQQHLIVFGDAWLSDLAPGFSAILALGIWGGLPWLVSPLAATLTLPAIFLLGRALYGQSTGLLALLLLLSSPLFLLQSASLLPGTLQLLLTTLALLLLTHLERSHSFWLPLTLGVLLGWLTAASPPTGLAIAVPGLLWAALRLYQAGRSLGVVGPILLGWSWPILALLAYNRALTGNPLVGPAELSSAIGQTGPVLTGGHDLSYGLANTLLNVTALETDLFGWPVCLTLALAPLPFLLLRSRPGDWLLAGVGLALIVGRLSWWESELTFGPRLFYEATSGLVLLSTRGLICAAAASAGLGHSLQRRRSPPSTGLVYALLLVTLLSGNLFSRLAERAAAYRHYGLDTQLLQRVQASGLNNALVLVPAWPVPYEAFAVANDPLLKSSIIFARELDPPTDFQTRAAFPHRATYRLAGDRLIPLRDP